MKIKFKKIEIHNFLSYQDETFDFEKNNGMNLITGVNHDVPGSKNGAGKSGWALALTYALFGELPFVLNKENIPNRFIDDNETRVCLYIDSEKKHYKICSGMRKRSSYHYLYEIVNGKEKDITKSTMAETRAFIEKEILNADKNLFMRTIFLNSDPEYNFYNLSKQGKKEFIDKLFDVSVYSDVFDEVHGDVKSLEKVLVATQNQLVVLNRNSEDYINRSEKFKTDNTHELALLQEKLKIAEKEFSEKSSNIVERNTEKINECVEKNNKLSEKLSGIRMDMQKCEFSITSLKNSISNYKSKISEREKFISKHDILNKKLCEDCKGIFSKHYNLDTYREDIKKLESEITKSEEKIVSENAKLSKLKGDKDIIETEKRKLNNEIIELNSTYDTHRKEVSKAESAVNSLKIRIETVKNAVNPYLNLIETNNENMKIEMDKLSEAKENYNYIEFLSDILGQEKLKKYIIKDMVGVLNAKVKENLHRLGANYDIIFDEDMECRFTMQDKSGVQFHNFSSGEQSRISIATCFAFRDFLSMRSSIVSNILILDEFIDSNVDSQAIENIVDILKEFSDIKKQNIYLVSHRQEVEKDKFNRIIQIEKKNHISSIKYLKV